MNDIFEDSFQWLPYHYGSKYGSYGYTKTGKLPIGYDSLADRNKRTQTGKGVVDNRAWLGKPRKVGKKRGN